MMKLCQGATFDIATTSGIAQSVMLRFVDSDGAVKDISGNTFRCAVRGPGAAAIKCDPVDGSSARLAWSPLKAGGHAYDLFMISPDGTERPLIMGEIQAAPRVTPPGNEDVITIGDIKIVVPDAPTGEVKIIDSAADAAERAESAAQKATDASTAAQTARSDAESAAGRAGTSATSAASAATAAQQALDAIPQVDAAGNMTLAGGLTTAAVINANGGINIPVAPSMDTQAARFREVQLLQEMEFSPLRTYFKSPNPVPFGVLLDRFWWAANRDNMPAWTVVTADFNMINLDNNNSAYDGLTSCYFPMSCGLGYGRCFDSIAIGNTSFNADYASLDDDPFATPAGYMRYWVDIQIGRPANGQCAVSVRMSRWDNASSTAVNTTHQCSVPDSLALRGVALSMTSKHSGVWLVGFDKSAGRLVSYKVLPETFTLDSYNRAMSSRLSLAKTAGHCSVGVHAPNYYGGTVLGEWCDLIQIN